MRLTAAGDRLLPEAAAVLGSVAQLRRVAADVEAGAAGVVLLGLARLPGDRVPRLLDALAARAPGLQVDGRRLRPAARLEALRAGDLDAALLRGAVAEPGLDAVPLWSDPLLVALPADHPRALAPGPVRLGGPCGWRPRGHPPPFVDLVLAACRAAGVDPVPGPPFTDLEATLAEVVAAPSWTVFYAVGEVPRLGRVAVRPLAGPAVPTSLVVAAGPRPPALDHLVTAAAALARPPLG